MDSSDFLPLIVAHRGSSALAPENTMAAFRQAVADEAEGIEFDVRLARDGVPVVFHDADLLRVASASHPVSGLSSEELRNFDVGSWFNVRAPSRANPEFAAERIPTLAEVLGFLAGYSGIIYIELKCREAEVRELTEAVSRLIRGSHLLPRIIVKSFRLEAIPQIRRLCPEVRTAALFAPKIMTILRKEKHLVRIAHDLEADMISVHFSLATRKLMKKAAKRSLPVTIWTADNPRWIRRAVSLGLYAVITNNPARLLAERSRIGGE
jgi:glycerophosphoryl diester phosphodiesterase